VCPNGKKAVGGGYSFAVLGGNNPVATANANNPNDETSWIVDIINPSAVPIQATVYVVCVNAE
jgi:hypothetical protein